MMSVIAETLPELCRDVSALVTVLWDLAATLIILWHVIIAISQLR